MHISCVLFASNGSPTYKSLTKTKKYSGLQTHGTLKRVVSANAIFKHYKRSSLITVKPHAMVLSFLKANLLFILICCALQNTLRQPEHTFFAGQSIFGSIFHTLQWGHPSDTDKHQIQGHFWNCISFQINDI